MYQVRIGSSFSKKDSKIVYKTNNKQAAYRYGWNLVKKHGVFPKVYYKGRFEATLLVHESMV